jgi:uncharacterized protein (DUF924 family)
LQRIAESVLRFWFEELKPADWFSSKADIDQRVKERFETTLLAAAKGELFRLRETVDGRLAEIIVLDQFSRNIYRNSPKAFENDRLALVLSQELVALKLDQEIPVTRLAFAYMPYMHSESPMIHEEALKLFNRPGLEDNYKFELLHKDIIDRFGRYPHRNTVLGRESTPAEIEFMKTHKGF